MEELETGGLRVKRKSVQLGRGGVPQTEQSTKMSIQGYPSCKQLKLPLDGRDRVLLANNSMKGLVSTDTAIIASVGK